jgi:hypothetical protein
LQLEVSSFLVNIFWDMGISGVKINLIKDNASRMLDLTITSAEMARLAEDSSKEAVYRPVMGRKIDTSAVHCLFWPA